MDRPTRVLVGDVPFEVEVLGPGRPVVVVQTALDVHELRPLSQRLAAAGRHRVIQYHRRGYAGGGTATGPPSIERDAADCRELLTALGAVPADVVGASYSAAVALTLASSAPSTVRTVTVIEPPPVHVAAGGEFRAACARLVRTFDEHGPSRALDEFMSTLRGPTWRAECEGDAPGSAEAMERDAATFFARDIPALLSWRFGAVEAGAVRCPVLYVGGGASGPWFEQVRPHVLGLLPHAEDAVIPGAGHLLALTHAAETAAIVLDFLDRHR